MKKEVKITEIPSKIKIIEKKEEKKENGEGKLEKEIRDVSVNELDFASEVPTPSLQRDNSSRITSQVQPNISEERTTTSENTGGTIYETSRERQDVARNYDSGTRFVLPERSTTRRMEDRRDDSLLVRQDESLVNNIGGINNFVDPRTNRRPEPAPIINPREDYEDGLHVKRRKELW